MSGLDRTETEGILRLALGDTVPGLGTIGDCRLLKLIGEGGIGKVYLAQQSAPSERIVALKLLKTRQASAQEIAENFDRERRLLGSLRHPGIAAVYDAGVGEDGAPWFIMEWIDGVPINQFCQTGKLDSRERLQLFAGLCEVVQHAHTKGTILSAL